MRSILRAQGVPAPADGGIEAAIIDLLASGPVTNRRIVSATGAPAPVVTDVLRCLAGRGVIEKDPDGPARGAAVRWRASGTAPPRQG